MTVCIGAVCCNQSGDPNKSVVVASDRMVTMGGMTEFEHETPKLVQITDRVVVLMAGDAIRGAKLVSLLPSSILPDNTSVSGIAETARQRYVQLRQQQIDIEFFVPRGISFSDFYHGLQAQINQQIVLMIEQHVVQYNYGLELLVAGVDEAGGHLHMLSNPGQENNYGQIGFCAIGSGAIHAIQSMIGFGHHGGKNLHETVFAVYASKKRAEAAPGVGKDTDLAIIHSGGVRKLTKEELDHLEQIYNDYQKPVEENLADKVQELNLLE
jgi:20S proteasome alpha/beta subunit